MPYVLADFVFEIISAAVLVLFSGRKGCSKKYGGDAGKKEKESGKEKG